MVMPKRMYLARRNPSLSREQFRMRWRRHGAMAMGQATWGDSAVRYIHCDPIPGSGGLVGASDDHDGVGIILHASRESFRRRLSAMGERERIWRDEDETFAARVNTFGVTTEERLLRDGPTAGVKAMRFLWRRPGTSVAEFRSHWEALHAPLLLGTPKLARHIRRYAQNYPLEPDPGVTWGLDCDGIEETWYDGLASLLAAHAEPAQSNVIDADRDRFVHRSILLLVNEVVLFDARDPAAVNGAVCPELP